MSDLLPAVPGPTRTQRTNALFAKPELLADIQSHVTNGGSLIELCQTWQVRYADIMAWVRGDPERSKLYDQAIKDRSEWVKERLLHELRAIGLSDIRKLFDAGGNMLAPHDWPAEIAQTISSLEVDEDDGVVTKKVKMWDKIAALRIIGMHEKIFAERMDLTHGIAEDLQKARERANAPPPANTGIPPDP